MPAPAEHESGLDDQIRLFLRHLDIERGLSANTLAAYRRDLVGYRTFLDERAPNPQLVDDYLVTLGRYAPATRARRIAALRMFHRFLVVEGMAASDPTLLVEPPGREQSLPKALDVDELITLIEGVPTETALGRRNRALLEFMYASGARVSEAAGLDVLDVDLTERTALLTGKGDRQRLVPLGEPACDALAVWFVDRADIAKSDAVFVNRRGGRLSRQSIWSVVKSAGSAAGLPPERLSPHVLRHSAATHMVEGGADLRTVQEILGHASISTTQIYTRVSPRHLYEAFVEAHPRSRRRKDG